ncbi:PepSY domain-containing protein [Rhodocaloribacter litoris]|uniref:PepSY-associated TM helix domain-containing protein n=1 Tax=Rhodocaloribacter litoris TaxID=2558931 RepID=UPI00141F78E8|nr:PepSY-associated TM helix domain-containing protein [Rhodocaloribacter litoris]QXD14076.1 PepSY domain-containing protein [Rhodocaloribacter litoris]
MTLRQFIGKLHLWLGLGSGLIVFIVAITGCLYVFEEELLDVFDRDVRFVEPVAAPKLPPSEAFEQVRATIGPGYGMMLISYTDPARTHQVWAWDRQDPEHWIGAYVHPYTGEVLEHFDYHDTFWSIVVHLHTTLLLPHEIGRIVVGTATLVFVVLLLSGLVLWFPANRKVLTTRKGLRSRFTITWGLSPKRLTYDLHSVIGFYLSWVVVFIALTGLVISFEWVKEGVYRLATGGEALPEEVRPMAAQPTAPEEAVGTLDAVYRELTAAYPEAHGVVVYEPLHERAAFEVQVYPDEGTFYRRIERWYDPATGAEIAEERFEEGNAGDRLLRMNYDIHTGAILGLPGRLLAFFASLLTATLPVTGFLVWFPRWRRKRRRRQREQTAKPSIRTKPASTSLPVVTVRTNGKPDPPPVPRPAVPEPHPESE